MSSIARYSAFYMHFRHFLSYFLDSQTRVFSARQKLVYRYRYLENAEEKTAGIHVKRRVKVFYKAQTA